MTIKCREIIGYILQILGIDVRKEIFIQSLFFVKFSTKIYHCNVSNEGDVNIPSLNNWNPNISMSQVLSDIFSLFYVQNRDEKFNPEILNEFLDRNKFEAKAKEYVKKYALI